MTTEPAKRISNIAYMLRQDPRVISTRGRRISVYEFCKMLRKTTYFRSVELNYIYKTVKEGIMQVDRAEQFAKVLREYYDIDCIYLDVIGFKVPGYSVRRDDDNS